MSPCRAVCSSRVLNLTIRVLAVVLVPQKNHRQHQFRTSTTNSMEEITQKVNDTNINDSAQKRNRIQVSNTKKPLFFYVNLAKRYLQQYNEVELSALGMAISTVVTITEILKNNGFAVEKKIATSMVNIADDSRSRPVQKAKIEILLGKSEKFDELMAAAAEEKAALEVDEQS